jgi:hypothetical protein
MTESHNEPLGTYDYFNEFVAPIPGWLHRGAAIRTMDMLAFQERSGVTGSLVEIGVDCGKYFSVLMRHTARTKSVALGIDTFQFVSVENVIEHLARVTAHVGKPAVLYRSLSSDCTASSVLAPIGERPRFISVDGSHERDDVYWDLGLAEQLLGPGGIVAIDDFMNCLAFGVNEAAHLFFAKPRRLVPWAYIENKLFLADRSWAPRFRTMLEETVMQDEGEPHSRAFRERLGKGRGLVEQKLWGALVLLLPDT